MGIFSEPNALTEVPVGYHGAVWNFKRRLIETALREAAGNRTHAARVLGLQRTYLLRLIRELHVIAPPPPDRRRAPPPSVFRPPEEVIASATEVITPPV